MSLALVHVDLYPRLKMVRDPHCPNPSSEWELVLYYSSHLQHLTPEHICTTIISHHRKATSSWAPNLLIYTWACSNESYVLMFSLLSDRNSQMIAASPLFICSFIQKIFIECLLFVRHCSSFLECRCKQVRWDAFPHGAYSIVGEKRQLTCKYII